MKTFRAELLTNGGILVDYMEFETDTLAAARKYAHARFAKAYPYIEGEIKINEL
jgi:hypothetical protein